ncbi:PTS-dependent dihydroxyacetone kinase phosphotransferase subunit DhaM [Rubrobacter xylanophilus]|uniref:phosphoenolpyruvate--glycerone phosphotransferase n=1 Tax=Rubrobacter xylanophilus TaxID=49319 RepID=A0A510HEZ2_9ACTN|nr:dihydroxyacetone kinase phosphoryl donor subunit DhaM [Rubrobacter xylanophilus]BBL78522.1 PTS-dependent dihydroxyacetone kinase phosphotransferase subunit DhaM [Rubrobacter xylanophilus]
MVGLVLVSHSPEVARGTAHMVAQMVGEVEVIPVGGDPEGGLGTNPDGIRAALQSARSEELLVFMDIGSAILAVESVVEGLPESLRSRVRLVDAPFVEGAFAAGVLASTGAGAEECVAAAVEARTEPKLHDA